MRAHSPLYWLDGGDRDGFVTGVAGFVATAGEGRALAVVVVDLGLAADAAVVEAGAIGFAAIAADGSGVATAGFGLAAGAAGVGADATALAPTVAAGGRALTDAAAGFGLAAGAAIVGAGTLL